MRVFVTGATGFIGTAVVAELIAHGHAVTGLTRSEAGADALRRAGAEPRSGDLEDPAGLRAGAAAADAVIHTAFVHDFRDLATFVRSCELDRDAIVALGEGLAGTGRPLIVSGGIAQAGADRHMTERDDPPGADAMPRVSEQTAMTFLDRNVTAMVMRLPQVHDTERQGLVSYLIDVARAKGVSAYVGDGSNRWAAAHVRDVARLYRLALENATPGARYHAIAEEGVPLRDIAETIGARLGLPVASVDAGEAAAHFGFVAMFAGRNLTGSSDITRRERGWEPTGPGLLEDLRGLTLART